MASRRTFLEIGLGACTVSALIRPISGRLRMVPYYKAIFDERFHGPCLFAAGAAERHIPTAPIHGDITRLFFNDLDLRWKEGPVLLAGYTTPASLFCLDLLSRDRGMRVSRCLTRPSLEAALGLLDVTPRRHSMTTPLPSSDPSLLVFWIIAPNASASTHQHI
jgi:hypothetical protein